MEKQIAPTPQPPKKQWVNFFILFLTIIIAAGLTFAFYVWYQIYQPLNRDDAREVPFLIEKGSRVKEIAGNLEKNSLIRSGFWFKVYVLAKKQGVNLQAGEYLLSPAMDTPEILQIMSGGKIIPNEVAVTFPEGFTMEQIKARLSESGIQAAAEWGNELVDGYQLQYKLLSELSPEQSLEGFLFPDTYRFKKDMKKTEIIKRFLDNFDKKFIPAWRAEMARQNKTIYQIVRLASIVQQEALDEQEMPMISGIFWNRLKIGMPLESDATINYVTGKKDRQVSDNDTKIPSPYNTYLHQGLPPTPICNPGEAAIKAAIYFQQSDSLYFLHPLNSPAVYSKTLEEHNRNKAKYLK